MKYRAVIFDLFGTLVDGIVSEHYENSIAGMAEALGADHPTYKKAWTEMTHDRNTGVYATSRDVMAAMAEKLGIQADERQLQSAVDVRTEFSRLTMVPRGDALSVLRRLRVAGLKTALVSNCSPITEEYWAKTLFPPYFDVTVFSSSSGCRKPDPQIYRKALDKLGVAPDICLYVGDGDNNELNGAREMGVHPVMIKVPSDEDLRFDAGRQEWDGPVIESLSEVLELAGIR